MFFSKNGPSKVIASLMFFHFLTSQITMLLLLGIGALLFFGSETFLIKSFIVNAIIAAVICLPSYVYIQWKVLNQKFFKSQLKKKLNQEWNQEIKNFFWKKICILFYATIIGSSVVFGGISMLIQKYTTPEISKLTDFILFLPLLAVMCLVYRYLTNELDLVIKKDKVTCI